MALHPTGKEGGGKDSAPWLRLPGIQLKAQSRGQWLEMARGQAGNDWNRTGAEVPAQHAQDVQGNTRNGLHMHQGISEWLGLEGTLKVI